MGSKNQIKSDLIGRVLAEKYALRNVIGSGATGTVYEAEQMSLGRQVAVKILRSELADDPRFVRRFNDEALAASRLNHPHVVSIFDFGQSEDGLFFLVMEFLRGVPLSELVRIEPLSTERVIRINCQILSALEDAHDVNVIHSDLKPDNVVVDFRRDGSDFAKVVDFGIARLVGDQEQNESDIICGTPDYMAPEVIRGNEPTYAADVYSVGIMLYELMTGTTPFMGAKNTLELLRSHIEREVERPSERTRAKLDANLESLVMRALEKEPSDRFESAGEFRKELELILEPRLLVADKILCKSCGVWIDRAFRFCSECGEPRLDIATENVIVEPLFTDDCDTQDIVPDAELGGIWPLPFIGRKQELSIVTAFVRGDKHGCLQLSGRVGSGRSRLIHETAQSLIEDDIDMYIAGADPSGTSTAYYPIRSMVTALLGLPPYCDLDEIKEALLDLGLSERDCPGVAELLGHQGELRYLDSSARHRELTVASIRVLKLAGQMGNTALVFEDVDHYDQPSRELLRSFIAMNRGRDRIAIVLTTETIEKFAPLVTAVTLNPLEREDMQSLVEHCVTHKRPDGVTADALSKVTYGHPGSIQQWIRFLLEGGQTKIQSKGYANIIESRLDFLPQSTKVLLQSVAVMGLNVPLDILRELNLSKDSFDERVQELCAREWLSLHEDILYFSGKIIRDIVYESTPVHVRQALHQRALQVLEEYIADPAELGAHAMNSDQHERAAELLGRGADNATYQLDRRGAARLYNLALSSARRQLMAEDNAASRIRFVSLSIRLSEVLRVSGERTLARGILVEARDFAREIPELSIQLLRGLAHLVVADGKYEKAISYLRGAISEALTKGRTSILCPLYHDLAAIFLEQKKMAAAILELEEGISVVTMGEGTSIKNAPPEFWRLCFRLSQVCTLQGTPRKARRLAIDALRHAKKEDTPLGVARVQSLLARLCEEIGEGKQADLYRSQAIKAMRDLGDRRGTAEMLLANSKITQGVSRLEPARIREARILAEEVGWTDGVRRAKRASGTGVGAND